MLTKSSKNKKSLFGSAKRHDTIRRIGAAPRNRLTDKSEPHRGAPRIPRRADAAGGRQAVVGVQAEEGDDSRSIGNRLGTVLKETAESGFAIATGEWYDGLNAISSALPAGRTSAMRSTAAARRTSAHGTV